MIDDITKKSSDFSSNWLKFNQFPEKLVIRPIFCNISGKIIFFVKNNGNTLFLCFRLFLAFWVEFVHVNSKKYASIPKNPLKVAK